MRGGKRGEGKWSEEECNWSCLEMEGGEKKEK